MDINVRYLRFERESTDSWITVDLGFEILNTKIDEMLDLVSPGPEWEWVSAWLTDEWIEEDYGWIASAKWYVGWLE